MESEQGVGMFSRRSKKARNLLVGFLYAYLKDREPIKIPKWGVRKIDSKQDLQLKIKKRKKEEIELSIQVIIIYYYVIQ